MELNQEGGWCSCVGGLQSHHVLHQLVLKSPPGQLLLNLVQNGADTRSGLDASLLPHQSCVGGPAPSHPPAPAPAPAPTPNHPPAPPPAPTHTPAPPPASTHPPAPAPV